MKTTFLLIALMMLSFMANAQVQCTDTLVNTPVKRTLTQTVVNPVKGSIPNKGYRVQLLFKIEKPDVLPPKSEAYPIDLQVNGQPNLTRCWIVYVSELFYSPQQAEIAADFYRKNYACDAYVREVLFTY